MTTYNCAEYVEETIESILAQIFTDFVFLIIDDGSTDDTCLRISRFNDTRIRFLQSTENKGVGARLSEALKLINTPYIAKVDADDISLPTRFQQQYEFLQQHPEVDIVKCYVDYFADSIEVKNSARFHYIKNIKEIEINAVNNPSIISKQLKRWLCFPHTTYMARSEVVFNVGYPESRMFEDYSLFYKAVEQGYQFGCVCVPLVKIRISNRSTTAICSQNTLIQGLETIIAFKWEYIDKLQDKHQLYIFGSGQLAKALAIGLIKKGVAIHAFLDRVPRQPIEINSQFISVNLLDCVLNNKGNSTIIVAAQPVRTEICNLLERNGWIEWDDYMVIA